MKSSLRVLLLTSTFVLLSAGCSKQAASQPSPTAASQPQEEVSPTQPTNTAPKEPRGNAPIKLVSPPQATSSPAVADDGRPWFAQTVEASNLNQPKTRFTVGQTAFEVLDATHQVKATDYGSMGKFVTSIDGHSADNKHFWEFYVNGKSSNVGASSYKLQPGDVVEWKLSELK